MDLWELLLAESMDLQKALTLLNSEEKKDVKARFVHILTEHNKLQLISDILKEKPELVEAEDILKRTTLSYARTPEMVNLLLDNGADINHKDELGCSPIFNAIANAKDYPEVFEAFITHPQLNVNIIDNSGITPLYVAVEFALGNGNMEPVRDLLQYGAKDIENIEKAKNDVFRSADDKTKKKILLRYKKIEKIVNQTTVTSKATHKRPSIELDHTH